MDTPGKLFMMAEREVQVKQVKLRVPHPRSLKPMWPIRPRPSSCRSMPPASRMAASYSSQCLRRRTDARLYSRPLFQSTSNQTLCLSPTLQLRALTCHPSAFQPMTEFPACARAVRPQGMQQHNHPFMRSLIYAEATSAMPPARTRSHTWPCLQRGRCRREYGCWPGPCRPGG